ncbi:MAG TPA: DUF4291 domain-containing protein [Pseudonocardiaceae bacterium]
MAAAFPYRQVRAEHDDDTITVYQAYPPGIADAALAAGTFVAPFKRERMTWIKPSFLWMAYRSGWAGKPGQERVLAVRLRRDGFAWALAHSCLSHYDPDTHADQAAWSRRLRESPVRIQWDPERGLHHEPLAHRAIQVGLRDDAVHRYVDEWIVSIADLTPLTRTIADLVEIGRLDEARAQLPAEPAYPLPADLAEIIGATPVTDRR